MSRVQRADEQFIRQQIRKILAESHQELLLENEFGDFASPDEVYKTFIGPFVNVLKVAKTAFKDVSSATLISLSHAFSFSEKNREKLRAKYKIDRQKYQQEYAETMKDIDATLASSDAKLMAFMFNPGVFLGTQMIKQAADVGEPVTDYVKMRMDWISPELDAVFRDVDTKRGAEAGPARGLLGDLKGLFFGEGYQSVTPLLEAEDEEEKKGKKEEEKEPPAELSDEEVVERITKALKASAWGKQLRKDAENIVKMKMAEIEEVKGMVQDQMAALSELTSAKSLEEIAPIAQKLKTMDVDLTPQLQEVEKVVAKKKEELAGPDGKTMMDDLRKLPDGKSLPKDAGPEDFVPLLEKGILASMFQGATAKARQELLQGVMDFVAEDMKPSEVQKFKEAGPLGEKYSDVIMNFSKELANL